MRHLAFLVPLGRCLSAMHALPYYSDEKSGWIRWLMRVIMRTERLNAVNFNDKANLNMLQASLVQEWLNDQVNFHTNNAVKSLCLLGRLHKFSNVMFIIACTSAFIHVVMECLRYHPFFVGSALAFLSIICPLWGMVGHSLGQYAELKRLHDRSTAMARKLTHLRDLMENASSVTEMGRMAAMAADTMIQEAVDWKIQYSMPTVALA